MYTGLLIVEGVTEPRTVVRVQCNVEEATVRQAAPFSHIRCPSDLPRF
jgi:hypothetical protein